MEQITFYIFMFCIGTLFGSFFTLAVHRIPLHQDITHKRSYCPNCNHKLSFFDMIPVLSYIFLGGKCRYCKKKIRPRYLFLEILTGITFLLFAMSLNISFSQLNISKIIYLIFGILYFTGLIIIAGIDREHKQIRKGLLVYELIVICIYMVYLYTVENANIYRYVIYLLIFGFIEFMQSSFLRKYKKDNYLFSILELCMLMAIFEYEYIFIYTVGIVLLTVAIKKIMEKIMKKKNKDQSLPIASFLCYSNILVIIMINYLACRGGN